MKIRTKKDVELLDQKIKTKLGIDVQKYRNDEIVEDFVELIVFPEYVITYVIRPILIALLLFVVGFYLINLVHIEYLLYVFIGFFLFLITGIFIGLLFLTWKMKTDIWGIIDYSLDIMNNSIDDMDQVNDQITEENKKDVLSLLFKGIIHIVTIPMMTKAISEKVPFVGRLVNNVVKKILRTVSDKMTFDEDNLQLNSENIDGINPLENYKTTIKSVSNGLEKTMGFTFRIAQFPLKLGFIITFLLLVTFIYLIN